ncbi:MAG: hypothetical protein E1N59_2149 [Puniceicoccaceae bacterium 5H]|nr:MAG: hypothetical protein E1N59_2149 [Puniceicoccaceae bacterium 5H]
MTVGVLWGVSTASAQAFDLEAPGYPLVFEGVITATDDALLPEAAEGLVLSGSMLLRKKASGTLEDQRGGTRYGQVAELAELALDRFRVATYWMQQRSDVGAELEVIDRPSGEDTDVIELLLPINGDPIGEQDFRAAWLYLWLEDPQGDLVDSEAYPQQSPTVEQGAFQLVFWSDQAERFAMVEGDLNFTGADFPETTPEDEAANLRDSLRQLGDVLTRTEARMHDLEKQLQTAQQRIASLNQTVDGLIDERAALQAELEQLREQKAKAPEEMLDKLVQLEAQVAMEKLARQQEADRNIALADSLARAEQERKQARDALADLQETVEAQERQLAEWRKRADAPRVVQRDLRELQNEARQTTPDTPARTAPATPAPTRPHPEPVAVAQPAPKPEPPDEDDDNGYDRIRRIGSRRR